MFEALVHQHAANDPNATAFRTSSGPTVTYATVAVDVRRCSAWLGEQGVAAGDRAILQLDNPYLHWIMFLALEAHGAISIGDMNPAPVSAALVGAVGATLVFSSQAEQRIEGVRWFSIDGAWISSMRERPAAPLPDRRRTDEDPVCIVFSSGTTGAAKKVLLTRGMIDLRTLHAREAGFLRPRAQIACLLPFQSIGGILAIFQAWLVGGSIGWPMPATDWEMSIRDKAFDTLVAAPIHLDRIVSILPTDMPRPDNLVILCGGGVLSHALAKKLGARLTDEIVVSYASTEMGLVTKATIAELTGAEESAGPVLPWMTVEVVDEAATPVPVGQEGEIRVRGEDVVDGYFEDADATTRWFRDGWYYPGDIGRLDGRVLTVTGRVDEMINIGGRKAMPVAVEGIALHASGLADLAAFAAPHDGIPQLWIAYQSADWVEPSAFAPLLRHFPAVRVARVDAIPRNPMGKVERRSLAEQAAAGALDSRPVVAVADAIGREAAGAK